MDTPELPQNDTQTTSPSTPVTPPPPATGTKRKYRILFLLAVPIAIFVLLAVWQMYAQDDTTLEPELTTTGTVAPTPLPANPPRTWSYPSPTGEYTLTMTEVLGSSSCTVEIFDAQGELVSMQFSFETVSCGTVYVGTVFTEFLGWVNPTSVLFETGVLSRSGGEDVLMVYKIGGEQTDVTYDTSRYEFLGVNYDLSQWLYLDKVFSMDAFGTLYTLYIMDNEQTQLRDPLAFGPDIRPFVLYDVANNGYFIGHSQSYTHQFKERGLEVSPTFSAIEFTFQWIDGETLEVHDLGTKTWEEEISLSAEWCSHSIDERKVSTKDSIPGTIIFSYDCDGLSDTHPFASEIRFEVPR